MSAACRRAAVIGSPIAHSRSPWIFAFLSAREGHALAYAAREVRTEALAAFLDELRADDEWVGVNVTIPHKEAVARALGAAGLTEEAAAIGAVNVIEREPDGRLRGHNTDVIGVARMLADAGCEVAGAEVALFGAGGAARAVAWVLGRQGATAVYLVSENGAAARAFAADFGRRFPHTEFRVGSPGRASRLRLAIQATPLGMSGVDATRAGVPAERHFDRLGDWAWEARACAFDLIYLPEHTPFLGQARALGLRALGGLDLLIHQAVATWAIWFGEPRDRDALTEALRAQLQAELRRGRPVFLTGAMGAGKSTVGRILARRLGWEWIDTDAQVEARSGRSIAEVFAGEGEAAFRALERAAVREAAARTRVVVSLGGGALQSLESRRAVEGQGRVVYLDSSPEALMRRLARTRAVRPLLAAGSKDEAQARLEALLRERLPVYRRAWLRVRTDGRAPEAVADEILRALPEEAAS
jgi:shikimate dehydrogenase